MSKRDLILEINGGERDLVFADGFDEAILGLTPNGERIIYSFSKAVEILTSDMTEEEAIDFLHFNTLYDYGGDMPIWVMDDMF
jgi:hypothetical protein